MTSKNILFKRAVFREYHLNSLQQSVLKTYFKENFDFVKSTTIIKDLIYPNVFKKIMFINRHIYFLDKIKNKIKWVYKKLIFPFTNEETKNIIVYDTEKCNESINEYFSIQFKVKKINEIVPLIIYQYIFLKHVQDYLFVLSDKENYYIHIEIYSNDKTPNIDKNITHFINNFINSYNIIYKPLNLPPVQNELSENDKIIINFLQKIIQNIIKKTQKLGKNSKLDFEIITYGSYTSYILNKNVKYNDIDIYHSNPLKFLIIIMMAVKFILNIDIDIFKIPYILGHLSLRYKNVHFTDCIYMDSFTINNIPTTLIDNILFVDPLVQMLNNFRMMSEIRRMSSISADKSNTCLKYTTLLNYAKEKYGINFGMLNKFIDFEIKIVNEEFLLINLKKIFVQKEGYDKIKHLINFDYLIISLCKPKYFLQLLNREDLIISKQYFALFNEIVVEFLNKDKQILHKTGNKLNENIHENQINIHESQININQKEPSEHVEFPKSLERIIQKNNVLLMTNISTDIYIKNYVTKEMVISKTQISNISKETILSSFVLYTTIKQKTIPDLIKFYTEILLSFIKFNNKESEFKLLARLEKCNNDAEFNNIYKQKKIKLTGQHLSFTLNNPIFVKNIFFYTIQNSNYYNYQTFLDLTNYNK